MRGGRRRRRKSDAFDVVGILVGILVGEVILIVVRAAAFWDVGGF